MNRPTVRVPSSSIRTRWPAFSRRGLVVGERAGLEISPPRAGAPRRNPLVESKPESGFRARPFPQAIASRARNSGSIARPKEAQNSICRDRSLRNLRAQPRVEHEGIRELHGLTHEPRVAKRYRASKPFSSPGPSPARKGRRPREEEAHQGGRSPGRPVSKFFRTAVRIAPLRTAPPLLLAEALQVECRAIDGISGPVHRRCNFISTGLGHMRRTWKSGAANSSTS